MKILNPLRQWYGRHPRISTLIILCLWVATFLAGFWSVWAMLLGLAVCILVTVIFRGVIPAGLKRKKKEKKVVKFMN
ncbi:MAG: hypothetical protein AAB731_01770 [Patescibacteria group bacterium]